MTSVSTKVAIVGFGLEGRSAFNYYQAQGADITICDQKEPSDLPAGVKTQLGAGYVDNLNGFDVIVRTVGMHPKVILAKNPGVGPKITTTVNEFLRVCPTRNIIGVTGTKGKGTTSMLTVKMLEAAGKKVYLTGNFGLPALNYLHEIQPDDWVVIELSSFMLYDLKTSPHIGICLMVHPEHIDWHGDSADYYRSKANMFAHQKPHDVAIYYANNETSHRIASASPGDKIPFYASPGAYVEDGKIVIDNNELAKTDELLLPGRHNWQNICAAATAAWQVTQEADPIRKVLSTFTGLPHRIELLRKVDDVAFYNDSFSSDPYASQAAIEALPQKKVIILGGYDRMIPLESLVKTIQEHDHDIRTLVLIGASAERMGAALKEAGYTNFHLSPARTMQEIVAEARAHAEKGDSVLLSPGFPSFDMFKNFEDRGLQFKEIVTSL